MTHSFHHLPVVADGRLVGMLSSIDITRCCLPMSTAGGRRELRQVREFMSTVVIKIGAHESVQRAAETMVQHASHALPVVNADDELIGIITTTDLMQSYLDPPAEVPLQDDATRHPLTEDRLTAALACARRAVAAQRDPYCIAATLLATQRRVASLEEVALAAKRYLNAGQDEHLHTVLTRAVEHLQRLDETAQGPAGALFI